MSGQSAKAAVTDIEIMMYLDGELDRERSIEVKAFLQESEQATHKATALGQVGELVRGNLELDTDDAESRLDALWTGIAAGIAAEESPVVGPAEAAADARATEALIDNISPSKQGWFTGIQGHVFTGLVAAAAAALLMFGLVSETSQPGAGTAHQHVPPVAMPVVLQAQEPEIETLEVYQGAGTIMTVLGDDGQGASAVIWIAGDTEFEEDPI